MESQSPGQPIFQIRRYPSTSQSSLYPMVVPDPVVCVEDINEHPWPEYPKYRRGLAKMLGIIQITSGVLCILLNVGMAVLNYNTTWNIAAGWWASPFMVFAGTFALSSSKIVKKITIHVTLWLSLISSFLTIGVIVQGTMAMMMGKVCGRSCNFSPEQEVTHYALSIFFILVGVCEFFASICQFVIGCQAVCIPQRPVLPFQNDFLRNSSFTNSAYPPPPPPYEIASLPENSPISTSSEVTVPPIPTTVTNEILSFPPSILGDSARGVVPSYLPSYEESMDNLNNNG